MVKRYIGGIMTAYPPTIGVNGATGFYTLSEHAQYKANNLWPTSIYSFPTAYQSLITAFSGSGTILYVDALVGNDSYNGNSILTAYATIDKANAVRAALGAVNVMIVVRPGTYSVSVTSVSSASYAFFDPANGANSTIYVCAPGKTVFNFTSGAARDGAICSFNNASSAMYGAIILRNNNGKTLNYSTAFFNNQTAGYLGTLYNCVVGETNANNKWAVQYDNGAAGTGKANNCSFYVGAAGQPSYGGSTSLTLTNCVFNYGYGTDNGTHNNELVLSPTGTMTSGTAFPPYVSPGTSTQGVYGGTYAWS